MVLNTSLPNGYFEITPLYHPDTAPINKAPLHIWHQLTQCCKKGTLLIKNRAPKNGPAP